MQWQPRGGDELNHWRTTLGRTALIRQRLTVAVGVVALVACGQSELRRALNEIVDQREAAAADQSAVYGSFESELLAELSAEWGATADDGCPDRETLPSAYRPTRSFTSVTSSSGSAATVRVLSLRVHRPCCNGIEDFRSLRGRKPAG